ncbi:MAG: hypothetical protein PHR35_11505 [Kiritimatiellae bacterium]|nr:hypothetical protein [Kiritimatiellia bacterium]
MRDRMQGNGRFREGRDGRERNPRFVQNLELAREGDEAAIDCLWKEFGVDYAREGGRYE